MSSESGRRKDRSASKPSDLVMELSVRKYLLVHSREYLIGSCDPNLKIIQSPGKSPTSALVPRATYKPTVVTLRVTDVRCCAFAGGPYWIEVRVVGRAPDAIHRS
jgi:hypothetical protein